MDAESTAKGRSQVRILMAAIIIFSLQFNFLEQLIREEKLSMKFQNFTVFFNFSRCLNAV